MLLGRRFAVGVLPVPWLFAGSVFNPDLSFDKNVPYFQEVRLGVVFPTGDGGQRATHGYGYRRGEPV